MWAPALWVAPFSYPQIQNPNSAASPWAEITPVWFVGQSPHRWACRNLPTANGALGVGKLPSSLWKAIWWLAAGGFKKELLTEVSILRKQRNNYWMKKLSLCFSLVVSIMNTWYIHKDFHRKVFMGYYFEGHQWMVLWTIAIHNMEYYATIKVTFWSICHEGARHSQYNTKEQNQEAGCGIMYVFIRVL